MIPYPVLRRLHVTCYDGPYELGSSQEESLTKLNDFYKTVYELRDDLKAAGQFDWSRRVDDTLYGTTSGEILGDLLVALHQLRGSETAEQLHLDERLDSMIQTIEGWIGPYRPPATNSSQPG